MESKTTKPLATISFRIVEIREHLIGDVPVVDTCMVNYSTSERITVRGRIGKLGDKLDFTAQLVTQ